MKQDRKAGLVACSNGVAKQCASELEQLKDVLYRCGIESVFSDYIYTADGCV